MKNLLISVERMVARWIGSACLLALIFSTGGCAAKHVVLVPATNTILAPQPNSAQGSSQGVSVQLRAKAWDDNPKTLDKGLAPIEITIQNDSGRPLAIRYEDLALIAADDRRYSDKPLSWELEGDVLPLVPDGQTLMPSIPPCVYQRWRCFTTRCLKA